MIFPIILQSHGVCNTDYCFADSAKEDKPEDVMVDGDAQLKGPTHSVEADMAEADSAQPANDGDSATDGPSKTNYQMSVKTDEKSSAVSDSQAGDASTHQKSTEVKAAAQVEEGITAGSAGDVGKLDVHLTYLWQVHRVNYYVGGMRPALVLL